MSKKPDSPPARHKDDLVPHANRLLSMAARGAWAMTKLLVGIAIRIPGWFVRLNRRNNSAQPSQKPGEHSGKN